MRSSTWLLTIIVKILPRGHKQRQKGADIKDLEFKVKYLLTNSNLEIHDNGKIFINSSQTYLKGRGNIQI
jgi:hypothetical protein